MEKQENETHADRVFCRRGHWIDRRMRTYLNCLRLNLRMLRHVLGGRWLGSADYAASYDRLAPEYDANWLLRLRPVTDRLLGELVLPLPERILDLGCGTGYSALILEELGENPVTCVDVSQGMLDEARRRGVEGPLVRADMLEYLSAQTAESFDLVFSGWAIGYSRPEKVIAEAARILAPGGLFAFVVNLASTLPRVFYAYRRTLAEYPELAQMAIRPHFPADAVFLERMMGKNGFEIEFSETGAVPVEPPEGDALDWLLKTGILAGFDRVLPLGEGSDAAGYFRREFAESPLPLEHCYCMMLGRKPL